MDAVILISEASAAGLRLWLDGENLRVSGPKAAAAIVERIKVERSAVMAALRTETGSTFADLLTRLDEDGRMEIEERAAILEFDANLDRFEAERRAAAERNRRAIATAADLAVIVRFFDGSLIEISQDRVSADWICSF
jgi:hypothetical protein